MGNAVRALFIAICIRSNPSAHEPLRSGPHTYELQDFVTRNVVQLPNVSTHYLL